LMKLVEPSALGSIVSTNEKEKEMKARCNYRNITVRCGARPDKVTTQVGVEVAGILDADTTELSWTCPKCGDEQSRVFHSGPDLFDGAFSL